MKRFILLIVLLICASTCYRLIFSYYILILKLDFTKHKYDNVYFFPYALKNPFKQNKIKEKIVNYLNSDFEKRLIFLTPKDTIQRQFFGEIKHLLLQNGFDIVTMKKGEDRLPNIQNNLCILVESNNCKDHYCKMVFVLDEAENKIIDFY